MEEKQKGEARMEEEPNRTSGVGAGSWECLCVQVSLYLLICLLSQPRAILTYSLLTLFPVPGSEQAVLWYLVAYNQMVTVIRAEFLIWGEGHVLLGSLRVCLSFRNTLGCSWSPVRNGSDT